MPRLHPITVDDREPHPSAMVDFLEAAGCPARVGRLASGDFQWVVEPDGDGEWTVHIVERKTIADFLASTNDGRIASFIEGTGGLEPPSTLRRYLLLEGDQFGYRGWGREWTDEQFDNALTSLYEMGVCVVRSRDEASTGRRLAALWRHSGRGLRSSLLRVVLPVTGDNYFHGAVRDGVRLLMCLPGFGEERAAAVLRAFGSVERTLAAMLARDYGAFAPIHGVGKGLVNRAADFLEKEIL